MPYVAKGRMREYQREWMAQRRAALVAELGGKCVQCGSTENLEIDHVDRKQKTSHRIASWQRTRQVRELLKCQLLCRECHIEKTRQELRRPIPHGTAQGYKRGCKCGRCTAAKCATNKRYRKGCTHGRGGRCTSCRYDHACACHAAGEPVPAPHPTREEMR